MALAKRYEGGFISIAGTHYRFEIWQEGWSGGSSDIAVTSDPLTIEWSETDKLEPVQSSNAKLTLYSDDDRQFVDLYTVQAGSIRLDIYREDVLYWSGTLDPELYEEPFAYKTDYGVELTFSDLSMLDRLNWQETGFMTLQQVIETALSLSCIHYSGIVKHISTSGAGSGRGTLLETVSVQCQNLYNEDGEAMSVREVLDEVLRPFSLRLIQKAGNIYIYDLNEIYTAFNTEEIVWDADDSTLSIDKTYNDLTLTFSPYEKVTILDGNVNTGSVSGGNEYTTYVKARNTGRDEIGYNITLSETGKGLVKNTLAKYFRVDPVYSGNGEAGVAWAYYNFTGPNSGEWVQNINAVLPPVGDDYMIFRASSASLISKKASDWSNREYRLKVSLQMLFDPRYNPYEDASEDNEKDAWENQQDRANFSYLPIKLTLRDDQGNAILHLSNSAVKDSENYWQTNNNVRWISGESTWGEAYLCWYAGDRKSESGLGGWQTNKPIIGYYRGELPSKFDKIGEGEYIDLPNAGGYFELEVGKNIIIWDYNKEIKESNYTSCRHLMFKDVKIELVDGYGNSVQTKDVQYSAWINKDAKEPLKIDTILGTLDEPSPVALGQLYATSGHTIVSEFTRSDITDRLEKLLIATVYSNYSGRNIVLSGTTVILPSFSTYTDKNEAGNYILLAETQDLINDTSEIKMVQFSADNYEGIEFK